MSFLTSNLTPSQKIESLREEMDRRNLDGWIVPRVDIYQGEFVEPRAERLAWLTGFTGSAGTAVILKDKAIVFTDARYTLQLNQQIDTSIYKTENIGKISISKWIVSEVSGGKTIGYDPKLHTLNQIKAMQKDFAEKSIALKPIVDNLVDKVWTKYPAPSKEKIFIFPENIAGAISRDKKEQITKIINGKNAFATAVNSPDSLAWLLNIRGNDLAGTPVALSLGIIYADGRRMKWFVDEAKMTPAVRAHVESAAEIIGPEMFEFHIAALADEAKRAGKPVGIDFARAPEWFRQILEARGAKIVDLKDPCISPKSIKTPSEQAAIRDAHIRDGVALTKFLAWAEGNLPAGKWTEIDVAERLEKFRREDPAYQGPSFDTIAGFGANGAVIHYRATEATNKKIGPGGILLLDSGGQYHYGTTDVTRTIAVGAASDEVKRNFTTVLKGHIAVARAEFAEGTTGAQIDALARAPFKKEGIDYPHGTGHGVGCYLSVHEEATSLSARGTEPVLAGMLLSNEPGFYKEGQYGIRIESLVLAKHESGKRLGFETVTLAPIDKELIIQEKLAPQEKEWLNDYHARVYETLAPRLEGNVRDWLAGRTRALA